MPAGKRASYFCCIEMMMEKNAKLTDRYGHHHYQNLQVQRQYNPLTLIWLWLMRLINSRMIFSEDAFFPLPLLFLCFFLILLVLFKYQLKNNLQLIVFNEMTQTIVKCRCNCSSPQISNDWIGLSNFQFCSAFGKINRLTRSCVFRKQTGECKCPAGHICVYIHMKYGAISKTTRRMSVYNSKWINTWHCYLDFLIKNIESKVILWRSYIECKLS